MTRVLVVDLGMGNLRSVTRALERAGAEVDVSGVPEAIVQAEALVVPGQGHFADGAARLAHGTGDALAEFARRGRPYLGLCLGMQLLFDSSEEAPDARGLGWFGGSVRRFATDATVRTAHGEQPRRIPHMGWNQVESAEPMLRGWFYFVHSFHCVPSDPTVALAWSDYGESVCAVVRRDNVVGCQFHPEKSQASGAALLGAFVRRSAPWS